MVDTPLVPLLVRSVRRRVADAGTEVVQRFENIGVTSEQSRDQDPEQEDDERQDENKSHHRVSFVSGNETNSTGHVGQIMGHTASVGRRRYDVPDRLGELMTDANPAVASKTHRRPSCGADVEIMVGRMNDIDANVEHLLRTSPTITVVGASADPVKAASYVPARMQQHGWRIIPINPHADHILGEPVFRTLADVPEQIGLVDVFRPSSQTPEIARQAVAVGATALWLQSGIVSAEARSIAESAGLLYVEDRCLMVERQRLGLAAPHESAVGRSTAAVAYRQQAEG